MSKIIEDYKRKILRLIHCDRVLFFLYSNGLVDKSKDNNQSEIDGSTFNTLVNDRGCGTESTTPAIREGGCIPTTEALGEEGGGCDIPSTDALGEEGGGCEPIPTTMALGEEGGGCEPIPTTKALGEEGGGCGPIFTTMAIGEEGGGCTPPPVTYGLMEEGGCTPPPVVTYGLMEEGGCVFPTLDVDGAPSNRNNEVTAPSDADEI